MLSIWFWIMYCCIPTPTTRTGMIWVTLNMPSAVEECREPSGKCQGIVREFQIVWRVVTLCGTSCSYRSVNRIGLASGYASQHILSQSLSLEINSVAADRASGIKIPLVAWLWLLMLSSVLSLVCVYQRPHQIQNYASVKEVWVLVLGFFVF